jgi:hypothetical protein
LEKHPDKTFIGKIEKGFDFLGYHFSPHGLRIANITWSKFEARLYRLYEQKKASADWMLFLVNTCVVGYNGQTQVHVVVASSRFVMRPRSFAARVCYCAV